MSNKVEVEVVAEILHNNQLPPEVQKRILEEILNALKVEEEAAEEKVPTEKKQWSVIVSDPEGQLNGMDLVAWVVQIPESESTATVKDRVYRAAYDFNVTKRGRLLPVKAVGEAFENISSKFFKEVGLVVKTKEPVLVIITDNKIPVVATE